MLLSMLAGGAAQPGIARGGATDPEITGLTADSREVRPGFLFAAIAGTRTLGSRFVADAIGRGAVALLGHPGDAAAFPPGIPVVLADEPRRALALMAARFHDRQPEVILAVTGTNGKTSIAEFTRQLLALGGRRAASLGTLGVVRPEGAAYGALTTPDPVRLHAMLDHLAADGITHVALEASSHGLDQYRLDGVRLTAGAFNNLGRDHLDYHPTMEAYLAAKLRLPRELLAPGQTLVVNADGVAAEAAIEAGGRRGLRVVTTGRAGRDIRLVHVTRAGFRQVLEIEHAGVTCSIELPLIGDYQAGNALVAAALAIAAGEPPRRVLYDLARLTGVKGRLEVVAEPAGATVVVDYAHKPEALEAAIGALRPFARRIVCIVGCGGDRDRGKRPIMGRIAAEQADIAIVTDDNPRSEVPAAIRAEVMAGAVGGDVREIGDRAVAIRAGLALLDAGDVLLIAGKGHETGQIIGAEVLPFSDHEEVAKALAGGDHG